MKPCPFCGKEPIFREEKISIGGGDFRYLFGIWCINSDCLIQPLITRWDESGYKVGDSLTNEQAKEFVKRIWNQRS